MRDQRAHPTPHSPMLDHPIPATICLSLVIVLLLLSALAASGTLDLRRTPKNGE